MSGTLNSLAYAQIPNNLTSVNEIDEYGSTTGISGVQNIKNTMDSVLSNTTVKRACCMAKNRTTQITELPVKVRIPVPKDFDWADEDNKTVKQKFQYIDKDILIPSTMCPVGFESNNKQWDGCDNFYELYCNNIKKFYSDEKGGSSWDNDEFFKYKPECACYNKIPDSFKGYTPTPKCFLAGCDADNKESIYFDPKSRGDCDMTICNQNIDFSKMNVGGSANIQTNLTASCGQDTAVNNPPPVKTSPPESNTTSPPESNTTSPPESNTTSPPESNTTSPPESDTASPQESDTASPQESDTASPQESDTASGSISDEVTTDNTVISSGFSCAICLLLIIICCVIMYFSIRRK
jgi:hypothetical protein